MSLEAAIQSYIAYIRDVDRLSPKTVYERNRWLRDFYIWAVSESFSSPDDFRIIDVKKYFSTKTSLSRNSLGALMIVMRAFFKYLQEEEEIPLRFSWNKIKPIAPEKVEKIVVPEDVVYTVLREIDDEQLKVIIYLAFGSGFRVSEIARLRVENLYDCYASVVKGKGRAGGKDRECRIHPEIMNYLHHYMARTNITSGYIIRRKQVHKNVDQDSPIDTDTIARWVKGAFAPHGYNVSPHIARYSFATNMYLNGADIKTVQVSLGHENVSTTQSYLKVPPKYIQESFDKYMTLRPVS